MTKKSVISSLKKYQKTLKRKKGNFLHVFERKMIYRTTKTENPETTQRLVDRVLDKLTENDIDSLVRDTNTERSEIKKGKGKLLRSLKDLR